jgi:hypothetical protein
MVGTTAATSNKANTGKTKRVIRIFIFLQAKTEIRLKLNASRRRIDMSSLTLVPFENGVNARPNPD